MAQDIFRADEQLAVPGGKPAWLPPVGAYAPGGWLQAEIRAADGTPIAGYRLDKCHTIRGNALAKPVTWRGQSDVSKLAGKPVRLHFVLQSMKRIAFQFAKAG